MKLRNILLIFFSLIVTSFSEPLIFADQQASAKQVKKKKVKKVHQKRIKAFENVQESFEQGDYIKTSKLLDELSSRNGLNDLELAYIANYRGSICFEGKDFDCSLFQYQSILERKSSIPERFYNRIVYLVAALHFSQKNYSDAIPYFEQHLLEKPSASYNVNILLARSYFELQDYEKALKTLQSAIEGNVTSRQPVLKPGWINMLIDVYKELNQLESAIDFINTLDELNPRTKYKLRIADSYGEIGQEEKMESIRRELIEQGLAGYKDNELIVWQFEGELLPHYRPPPTYPQKAIRRGLEGWVDILMDIDTSGETYNVRITGSSTKKIFDASAIESAQGYLFNPMIKDGEPTEVKDHPMRISFILR